MKAVRLHEFGGPEVLIYEEAPKPGIEPGEVLVRVRAIGVNPPDWYLREGYRMLPPEWRPEMPFPIIPGTDVAGTVDQVADDGGPLARGDDVYGMVRFPVGMAGESRAYAEYVSVPASDLAPKPPGVDYLHAAAAPMSALTAWQFLIDVGHDGPNPLQPFRHAPVELRGRTILINGAAGGVGHLALQLAKWRGATVIAVASGPNEGFLRDLGADDFIDYGLLPAEEVVRDADIVLDTVGGPRAGRFLRCLKRGGALFPVFPLGFSDHDEAERLGMTVSTTQVRSNGDQLSEIGRLLKNGMLRVAIDSRYPLADASSAHRRAAEGHIRGKIVLTVDRI